MAGNGRPAGNDEMTKPEARFGHSSFIRHSAARTPILPLNTTDGQTTHGVDDVL
jgi:hypothetical protein